MSGYQNKVMHLAGSKRKEEVQLVVNLFQSVLDGFIRGEMKKEEAEPAKVKTKQLDLFSLVTANKKSSVHTCDLCLSVVSPPKRERRGGRKTKV